MPVGVDLSGTAVTQPAQGSGSFPTVNRTITLNARRTYQYDFGGTLAVTGTDGAPQTLPLGSIARCRFLSLRVTGGEVRLRLTTPDGATQILPITGTFLLDNPNEGSQVTAVTLAADSAGVTIEYIAAGDAA